MTDYTTREAEAAAVARIAATPVSERLDGDSRNARMVSLPPGWTHQLEVPVDEPTRMRARLVTLTVDGFVEEVKRLAGARTPVVHRTGGAIVAHPDPTSIDAPAHDAVVVVLEPQLSDELNAWTGARALSLDAWERHVEECAHDIDAVVESQPAPSSADVLNDARTWHVEVRRTVRRIKADNGTDEEAKDELTRRLVGSALGGFSIAIPIFRHTDPVELVVRIDRDVDRQLISARIPQLSRVIEMRRDRMFRQAVEAGGWTLVV